MRRACRILHHSLNNILDYQDFLSIQSKLSNDEIRPLGIGITNLAYWHAKRSLKYGEKEALAEVKTWMEHLSFYLTEATVELAKAMGAKVIAGVSTQEKGTLPGLLADKVLIYGRDRESYKKFKEDVKAAAADLGHPEGNDVRAFVVSTILFNS
jgi:ribonucleotide reductase alpha subunit